MKCIGVSSDVATISTRAHPPRYWLNLLMQWTIAVMLCKNCLHVHVTGISVRFYILLKCMHINAGDFNFVDE